MGYRVSVRYMFGAYIWKYRCGWRGQVNSSFSVHLFTWWLFFSLVLVLARPTLFSTLRLRSKGCHIFYSSVHCAGTFCCYSDFLVVLSGTGRWQVELQGTTKARAVLAQSVISTFWLTTRGVLASHGVICVLHIHMCSDECSSRLRHLTLLQDLAADEPGSLFHPQKALQVMLSSALKEPVCRWNRSEPPSCSAHNHWFSDCELELVWVLTPWWNHTSLACPL